VGIQGGPPRWLSPLKAYFAFGLPFWEGEARNTTVGWQRLGNLRKTCRVCRSLCCILSILFQYK
jgi:hypothetical protein